MALCVIPWLVVEVARLVMEDGKMKDCLNTSGLGGEFSDDHTVLQGGNKGGNTNCNLKCHPIELETKGP